MLYIITSLTAVVASILIILWMNKREKKRREGFANWLYQQFLKGNDWGKTSHQLYQEYLKSKKQNK